MALLSQKLLAMGQIKHCLMICWWRSNHMDSLYPYQERVYQCLMAGKNVIVQAPTGAGKTLAALYPYFDNLNQFSEDEYNPNARLPLTCRYAVPMRVLATQFEREFHDYFSRLDRKRGTRLIDRYVKQLGIKV